MCKFAFKIRNSEQKVKQDYFTSANFAKCWFFALEENSLSKVYDLATNQHLSYDFAIFPLLS